MNIRPVGGGGLRIPALRPNGGYDVTMRIGCRSPLHRGQGGVAEAQHPANR